MSRGDSLARQLKLIHLLEDRRVVAVPEVAAELGYTQRTVYRDLAVLERVGVPIYQERLGRRARWRVVEGYRRKLSLTLSFPETLALEAGRKLLSRSGCALLRSGADAALEKVASALPVEAGRRARAARDWLSGEAGPERLEATSGAPVACLAEAIERRRTVEVAYRKPGATQTEARQIDPHLLHLHGGALYLIAFCHLRGRMRVFLCERIESAAPTGALFTPRSEAAPESFLHGAFGPWDGAARRVRLRFSAAVARLVAGQRMHPSQTLQQRSDGAVDLSLRVPLCPSLRSWILGWGDAVEVISPLALRRRVHGAHARAAAQSA